MRCHLCDKIGHIANNCRITQQQRHSRRPRDAGRDHGNKQNKITPPSTRFTKLLVNCVACVNSGSDNNTFSKYSVSKCSRHFMHLHIQFNYKVSALLDTGSTINVMSYILYNSVSRKYKSELLTVTNNKIVLVNNHKIQIDGIGTIITGIIEGNQTSFHV